jgi:hypothetical protein
MYNKDVLNPISFLKPIHALHLFIAICFVRTGLEFYHGTSIGHVKYILTFLFKVNEMVGLYAFWFCFDGLVRNIIEQKWYARVSSCSFFVYAFHAPLINYIGTFLLAKHFYTLPCAHLASYILIPLLLLPALILLDKLVHEFFPKFYLLFSGGRGEIDKRELVEIRREGFYFYLIDYVCSFIITNTESLSRSVIAFLSGCYFYCVRIKDFNVDYLACFREYNLNMAIA